MWVRGAVCGERTRLRQPFDAAELCLQRCSVGVARRVLPLFQPAQLLPEGRQQLGEAPGPSGSAWWSTTARKAARRKRSCAAKPKASVAKDAAQSLELVDGKGHVL